MSLSNGVEDLPTETNALLATSMDAKLMVATSSAGDVQQLKDLVHKQQQDANIMMVVMAKHNASVEKPHPHQGNMDPHLLALASSGSSEKLQALLNRENHQAASGHRTDGNLTTLRASSYSAQLLFVLLLQNSDAQICRTLRIAGAVKGARRHDHLKDNKYVTAKYDESKEMEVVKNSTETMVIGSVLITTMTFGITFAVPGGYIADDHNNGGTPVLARRYAFDAFIASNTLAFVFSAMALMGLINSGAPLLNPRSRKRHLITAMYLLSNSATSLAAAFASGAYVVLAPVAHKSAIATCVLSCLVPLYMNVEFVWRRLLLLRPLRTRKGLIWASVYSAYASTASILLGYWPLIFIFGWAAHTNQAMT